MSNEPKLSWARDSNDLEQAARFFARVIALDPAYISHGEIQTALSLDGKTWAPDLERRFVGDVRHLNESQHLLLAHDNAQHIVGAAIVCWDTSEPEAPFGVIEDLAVEPDSRKSGVGAQMVAFIEAEATARRMRWLFLESGKDNGPAHRFFEHAGFREISRVFAKRL